MDYAHSLIYRNKRILRDKCKNVYLFYLACYIILIFEINSDISRYESLRELKAQHANTVADVAEACIVYTFFSAFHYILNNTHTYQPVDECLFALFIKSISL